MTTILLGLASFANTHLTRMFNYVIDSVYFSEFVHTQLKTFFLYNGVTKLIKGKSSKDKTFASNLQGIFSLLLRCVAINDLEYLGQDVPG